MQPDHGCRLDRDSYLDPRLEGGPWRSHLVVPLYYEAQIGKELSKEPALQEIVISDVN